MSRLCKFDPPKKTIRQYEDAAKPINDALDEAAEETAEWMLKPTAQWSYPPAIKIEDGHYSRTIKTSDDRYNWIDKGTRARIIRPRRPNGRLMFFTGGKPKTKAGSMKGTAGAHGTNKVFAKSVRYPGIKARKFSAQTKDRMDKRWPKIMDKHLKRHFK